MAAVLFLFLLARPAAADVAPPDPPREPHHELRLDLGMFSAVGFGGATYTYAPVKYLLLESGVGVGVTGVQLSFMPKVALGNWGNRFIAGVGVAVGISPWPDEYTAPGEVIAAYWLNVDVAGYEHRFRNGLALSASAGFFVGLGGKLCSDAKARMYDGYCGENDLDPENVVAGRMMAQARVGIGYWF